MSLQNDLAKIYEGRAIAAPMVRVSCLSYRILCNRNNANGCFTEELVALKLKKSIREVVTFPVPLTLLPVGFRLLAADVEKAIVGYSEPSDIYHKNVSSANSDEDRKLHKLYCSEQQPIAENHSEDIATTMANNSKEAASSTITSLYLHPVDDDQEDATYGISEGKAISKKDNAIGDTTCGAYDLINSILSDENEGDDCFTHEKCVTSPLPGSDVIKVITAFRAYFGITTQAAASPITISSEALITFINEFNNTRRAVGTDEEEMNNQPMEPTQKLAGVVHFLPPSSILVHIKAVEYVQYDPFKKGFRRATAASFLPKTIVNPFPEGDRRPEHERWGTIFNTLNLNRTHTESESALSCVKPRHNDIRCAQVICQLGAANPLDAGSAAAVIACEVDGIDVNMGCPKAFSIQNGMGAALMKIPVTAGQILRAIHDSVNNTDAMRSRLKLWRDTCDALKLASGTKPSDAQHFECSTLVSSGFAIPISFKTRIFGTTEESVKHLTTVVASCLRNQATKRAREEEGAESDGKYLMSHSADFSCPLHAISLHARTRPQRSETDPLSDQAREIMDKLRTVRGGLISPAVRAETAIENTNHTEVLEAMTGSDLTEAMTGSDLTEATVAIRAPKGQPKATEMESEEVTPLYCDTEAGLKASCDGVYVPLANHIKQMTFIFNGSVASNALTSVPNPTFAGALLGRSCMWDVSVFNNYNFVGTFNFVSDDDTILSACSDDATNRTRITPLSHPIAIPSVSPHIPFHNLLEWAIPLNWGLPSEWLSMRKRITDLERFSIGQLGRVFIEVIRYFASYRKNTMYLKYYFTRTFSEFPIGKFTFAELEFLLLRDEDILVSGDCANAETEREKSLLEIATRISKINKNVRGHQISFTTLQSPNTWVDFYVSLKRFELCNWGTLKERSTQAIDATHAPSIEGGRGKSTKSDTKSIKAQMSDSDKFIFSVMQRGDEVISEIPQTAFLRKETI